MGKPRQREHHDEHMDESWLLPYSDLLTLLLAAFLAMLAASEMDAKKFELMKETFNEVFTGATGILDNPSPIEPLSETQTMHMTEQKIEEIGLMSEKQRNLIELKSSIDSYIQKNDLTAQVATKISQQELMIVISDHALFDSGSATVKAESVDLAKSLSTLLAKYPEYEVMVAGHTDNQPISGGRFASNWNLSSERSLNFMQLILENHALNPARFRSVGFGEYRPIDSNNTEAGRAKNRRVEISIF